MTEKMNLTDLPTEILLLCLEALDDFSDIITCRFVCRRLAAICKRMLFPNLNVCLTTESLKRLRYISADPDLARSVRTLTFDVALYSTELCTNELSYQKMCGVEASYKLGEDGWEWDPNLDQDSLRVIGNWLIDELKRPLLREAETLLRAFHVKYRELHDDQQLAIQECADISSFANILQLFTNLRNVKITDKPIKANWKFMKDKSFLINSVIGDAVRDLHQDDIEFWESGLYLCMDALVTTDESPSYPLILCEVIASICLGPGKWKFREDGEDQWRPSVTVLGDIFTALAESSRFPTKLEVDITLYEYLHMYKMTDEQMERTRYVLQKANAVKVLISPFTPIFWNWRFTLDDWRQLKKLIAAMSDNHTKLKDLFIKIDSYLDLTGSSLLLADNEEPFDLRWEKLESLHLEGVAFLDTELEHMAKHLPPTLQKLWLVGTSLRSGSWKDAIDCLRDSTESTQVNQLVFHRPYGAEYGVFDYPSGSDT